MAGTWNLKDYLKSKPVTFKAPSKWAEITTSRTGITVKMDHELQSSANAEEVLQLEFESEYAFQLDETGGLTPKEGLQLAAETKKQFEKLFPKRIKVLVDKVATDCNALERDTKRYLAKMRTTKSGWTDEDREALVEFVQKSRDDGATKVRRDFETKFVRLIHQTVEEAVEAAVAVVAGKAKVKKEKIEVKRKFINGVLIYGVIVIGVLGMVALFPATLTAGLVIGAIVVGLYLTAKQYDGYKNLKKVYQYHFNNYIKTIDKVEDTLSEAEKVLERAIEELDVLDDQRLSVLARRNELAEQLDTCIAEIRQVDRTITDPEQQRSAARKRETLVARAGKVRQQLAQMERLLEDSPAGFRAELEDALALVRSQSKVELPKKRTLFDKLQELFKNGADFVGDLAV